MSTWNEIKLDMKECFLPTDNEQLFYAKMFKIK